MRDNGLAVVAVSHLFRGVALSVFEFVLSSRNQKKSREVAEILAPMGITVRPISDFPEIGEIEEDGDTFAANAAKKAVGPAKTLGRWVIGEDSGLMVDTLGGAPGVYSARYSGEGATDEKNNAKLQTELRDVPHERRGAAYNCTVCLADPTGNVRVTVTGRCRGVITTSPRGSNGFGYDPYFLVPEYHRTFGELSSLVKHQISHRSRALALFITAVRNLQRSGELTAS
jgi:XTP/dITP diphosphohydrolase